MPKKEPLHEESITEKAIRLMLIGQRVVVQYEEHSELCAICGMLIAIRPPDDNVGYRRVVVAQPFGGSDWYIPLSIITEIEAGG